MKVPVKIPRIPTGFHVLSEKIIASMAYSIITRYQSLKRTIFTPIVTQPSRANTVNKLGIK